MNKSENNNVKWKKLARKSTYYIFPFIWNYRKYNLSRGMENKSSVTWDIQNEGWIAKGHKWSFGGEGNGMYLNYSNVFMDIYNDQNS